MLKISKYHTFVAMAFAATTLVGCAHRGIHGTFEERYRVFYTIDQVTPQQLTDDPDQAGASFRAMAGLNLAFEELAAEGFKLEKVEPILNGGGATKFTFRRRIPEGYKPTSAPMEFSGVYAVEDPNGDAEQYYLLSPIDRGFNIQIMDRAGETTSVDANWDGNALRWRNGYDEHTLELTPDARSVIHTLSVLPETQEELIQPSIVTEAWRIEA